ncbi:MAG TPA: spore cortex biosynthesis protein YabQ [Clostridia bacterium]|nr:spore cortex biosynthesis protein YabQ [Clostridia bacterium]
MEPLIEQFYNLLFAVVIGALTAFFYDIYSLIRKKFRFKRTALIIGDLSFWLIMIIIVYALLLVGNKGEVRFYHLIGMALGAFLYTGWLSNKAMFVTHKIIARPFAFLYRLFFRNKHAKRIGSGVRTLAKKLIRKLGIKI